MAAVLGPLMAKGGLILHGEQEFTYHRPVFAGDVLEGRGTVVDAYRKESKGKTMTFVVVETAWSDRATGRAGVHVADEHHPPHLMADTPGGSSADDAVLRRVDDGVAWITLNRPEAGNAITAAMRDQVVAWLEEASADLAVRAVVLTGARREGLLHRRRPAVVGVRHRPRPEGAPDRAVATPPASSARAGSDWWAPSSTARSR